MERRRRVGMLGQIRGTPRWSDDTVRMHDGQCRQTRQDADSPSGGSPTTGGKEGGVENNIFVTISNIS